MMKRTLLVATVLQVSMATVSLAQLTVGNTATLKVSGAGEAQSTVIAPGLKPQCPLGRILVSRDGLRPPTTGLVVSRDMGNPQMPFIEASFDLPPNATDYAYGTNDHDLLTLPNGDVLYITGAFSKRPLSPKPAWFDQTYRGNFGPGARSVVMTWRSTDGGQSFQFLSVFDPATVEGGVPAYPQFRWVDNQRVTTAPWDMGGSDGTLAKVAPGSDQLYMTFWVVGYNPKLNMAGQFIPDPASPVNKTLLVTSKGGQSWTSLGMMDGAGWRLGMDFFSKQGQMQLGFGGSTAIWTGTPVSPTKFSFSAASPAPGAIWGWDGQDASALKPFLYANIWANTVIGRVPGGGNNAVLVIPDAQPGKGNGCRVYFYDEDKDAYAEGAPVMPSDKSAKGATLHPTLIDPGSGPLLLYWYDLDGQSLKGTIRGRLILGRGVMSDDFTISQEQDKPYAFDLTQAQNYWYGDYHTAGGYMISRPKQNILLRSRTVRFYPLWVQPDNTARYAEVSYTYQPDDLIFRNPGQIPPRTAVKIPRPKDESIWVRVILPDLWKKVPRQIGLKQVVAPRQQQQLEVYDQTKQATKRLN